MVFKAYNYFSRALLYNAKNIVFYVINNINDKSNIFIVFKPLLSPKLNTFQGILPQNNFKVIYLTKIELY